MDTTNPSRNQNIIHTHGWSNPDSQVLYENQWPLEPKTAQRYASGMQCESCTHFHAFNADWGLCCCASSRHFTETVFEHFTCPWREQKEARGETSGVDPKTGLSPKKGYGRR